MHLCLQMPWHFGSVSPTHLQCPQAVPREACRQPPGEHQGRETLTSPRFSAPLPTPRAVSILLRPCGPFPIPRREERGHEDRLALYVGAVHTRVSLRIMSGAEMKMPSRGGGAKGAPSRRHHVKPAPKAHRWPSSHCAPVGFTLCLCNPGGHVSVTHHSSA